MGAPPPPDFPPPPPEPPAPPEVPSPPTELCPTIELPLAPNLMLPGIGLGMSLSPKGFALCGFEIPPAFDFNPNFFVALPPIDFPPSLFFALCLRCDLANPIDGDFGFGGGRVGGQIDPDADDEFKVD